MTGHQVHGMGTGDVAADWPALTADEVARVLALYPQIDGLLSLDWHSPRPFSAASLATARRSDGPQDLRLFIKRHHALVRDAAALRQEHGFIAHLRANGAPVADVLRTRDGDSVVGDGQWTYEVHTQAAGVDLYRDVHSWQPFTHTAHAAAAGRALARLHRAAVGYTAPARDVPTLGCGFTILGAADPLAAARRFVTARPRLADYLRDKPWEAELARLFATFDDLAPHRAGFTPLWTHNDWHASNLLWRTPEPEAETDVASVLDFGLSDRTCAVYDLALAIERNTIEWLRLQDGDENVAHLDHVRALVAGYESVSPLTPAQGAALVALLPLAHIEFALSEADYFHGLLRSAENAHAAYETYLLGHARWFAGERGRALLAYLRQHLSPHSPTAFEWGDDPLSEGAQS